MLKPHTRAHVVEHLQQRVNEITLQTVVQYRKKIMPSICNTELRNRALPPIQRPELLQGQRDSHISVAATHDQQKGKMLFTGGIT